MSFDDSSFVAADPMIALIPHIGRTNVAVDLRMRKVHRLAYVMKLPDSLWPRLWSLESTRPWPPTEESDVDRFVQRAAVEDLLPLLHAAPSVTEAIAAGLQRHLALLRAMQQRATRLHQVTVDLCRFLADEQFMLIKGADYRYGLYADPRLRPMRDIDVLVPVNRMDLAGSSLERWGLRRVFPGGVVTHVPWHHERTYVRADFAVDLHHSVMQRSRAEIDYDRIWSERTEFWIADVRAWRLSPSHALVVQCLMMAKDEYVIPLIRYVDLWLLLQGHRAALLDAARLASEWRCRRAFYASLALFVRVFPEAREIVGQAMKATCGAATRRYLDWLLPVPEKATRQRARLLRVWRKLNLVDTPRHLSRFAWDYVRSTLTGLRSGARRGLSDAEA